MDYIKYIDKFETAEDVQTALDNGELNKPYVAKVGDALDFNSMTPTTPVLGEWRYDEVEHIYGFYLNEQDPSYWVEPTLIATILNAVCIGNEVQARVWLSFDVDSWVVRIDAEEGSDYEEFSVGTDEGDTFETSTFALGTSETSTTVPIQVEIEGGNYIMLKSTENESVVIEMDTINPEYPE